MKKFWKQLLQYERICLIVGAVCTTAILVLLLSAKGAVESVLPAVLLVGLVEFAAGAGFLWRKDRKRAILIGVSGTLICVVVLVMLATGQL